MKYLFSILLLCCAMSLPASQPADQSDGDWSQIPLESRISSVLTYYRELERLKTGLSEQEKFLKPLDFLEIGDQTFGLAAHDVQGRNNQPVLNPIAVFRHFCLFQLPATSDTPNPEFGKVQTDYSFVLYVRNGVVAFCPGDIQHTSAEFEGHLVETREKALAVILSDNLHQYTTTFSRSGTYLNNKEEPRPVKNPCRVTGFRARWHAENHI